MIEHSPVKYVFIIGLFISFFLDGSVSLIFSHLLFGHLLFVPNITFIWLFYNMYFVSRMDIHVLWWSALAGLLYDWYYSGIIGIYVLAFPLAIYIGKLLYKYLPYNILTAMLEFVMSFAFINFFAFALNRLMSVTNMAGSFFLSHAFLPTIVFNLVVFLLLYVPIGVMFDRIE